MRDRLRRRPRRSRKQRNIRLLVFGALCALLLCFNVVSLLRYFGDAGRSASQNRMFQELYHGGGESTLPPLSAASFHEPAMRRFSVPLPAPSETPPPAASVGPEEAPWPGNPALAVSPALQKLRRTNGDIVGWLSIPGMLDQPVVQRDNSYYLARDYLGLHNANGALFLEEHISLQSRPDTYLIFGHNMKTGEMFGNLRLYQDVSYYRRNLLMDFNVLYEDGKYAVFAIADVDIVNGLSRYVPFMELGSMTKADREKCIGRLRDYSLIRTPVQVTAEDQLLILVTCEGSEDSRRVVAARRLRPDETAESMIALAQHAGQTP